MQQRQSGKQKPRKHYHKQQAKRSKVESDEIEALDAALQQGAPPRGSNPLALPSQPAGDGQPVWSTAKRFDELPISEYSKQGLREAKYVTMTAVQRAALPHALCGRDVLGAAKTGSGGHRRCTVTVCCTNPVACGNVHCVAGIAKLHTADVAVPSSTLQHACRHYRHYPQARRWPSCSPWWRSCTAHAGAGWTGSERSSSHPRESWPCRCAATREPAACARGCTWFELQRRP
jgi:hypothetical protein